MRRAFTVDSVNFDYVLGSTLDRRLEPPREANQTFPRTWKNTTKTNKDQSITRATKIRRSGYCFGADNRNPKHTSWKLRALFPGYRKTKYIAKSDPIDQWWNSGF